jgi:hypothetical protein
MSFIEILIEDNSIITDYNLSVNNGLIVNRGTVESPQWFLRFRYPDNITKEPDEEVKNYKSVNGGYNEVIPKLPFISIETTESRRSLGLILDRLKKVNNRLVTVYDYMFFKESDQAQGYTIRQMTINLVQALGSFYNNSYYGGLGLGWRIQLEGIEYD